MGRLRRACRRCVSSSWSEEEWEYERRGRVMKKDEAMSDE